MLNVVISFLLRMFDTIGRCIYSFLQGMILFELWLLRKPKPKPKSKSKSKSKLKPKRPKAKKEVSRRIFSRDPCFGCLKIFSALLLLALLGYLGYLYWSPIYSFASTSMEFVGSCLSSIIKQTPSVLHSISSFFFSASGKCWKKSNSIVTFSSTPVTEDVKVKEQTAKVDPIPTPIPPIIPKEELDDIFSRLRSLETKVTNYYDELNVCLTQLDRAVREESVKGRGQDQMQEIMTFHLRETPDRKIVTLSNFVTLWNRTKDENSDLHVKVRVFAENIATEAAASKSDMDQIFADVLELETAQAELKRDQPVETDVNKIKVSISQSLGTEWFSALGFKFNPLQIIEGLLSRIPTLSIYNVSVTPV